MDDKGPAKDVADGKTVGEHRHEGAAVIAEKRRQIARMLGVRNVVGIQVTAGIGKWVLRISGTLRSRMNMESVN